jgi:hypothetical protein
MAAHKIGVLRRHCEAVGRDPNEIEVTVGLGPLPPGASIDEVVRQAEPFAAVGVKTLMVGPVGADPVGYLESTIAPAVAAVRELKPAPL